MELLHKELTDQILKCFYKVYNKLGYGFLEKVYHKALLEELKNQGLKAETKVKTKVYYEEKVVGEFYPDILVNQIIIIELKSVETLLTHHEAQLLNYLKSTKIEVGLLLNFGPVPEFRRRVYSNDKK